MVGNRRRIPGRGYTWGFDSSTSPRLARFNMGLVKRVRAQAVQPGRFSASATRQVTGTDC